MVELIRALPMGVTPVPTPDPAVDAAAESERPRRGRGAESRVHRDMGGFPCELPEGKLRVRCGKSTMNVDDFPGGFLMGSLHLCQFTLG